MNLVAGSEASSFNTCKTDLYLISAPSILTRVKIKVSFHSRSCHHMFSDLHPNSTYFRVLWPINWTIGNFYITQGLQHRRRITTN